MQFPYLGFLCSLASLSVGSADPLRGRIVGGSEVSNISEYPFQLSLRYYSRHRCAGSILSSTWALTAAHCLVGVFEMRHLSFLAGTTFVGNNDRQGSFHEFSQFFLHPKYDGNIFDYDVAVAQVVTPFIFAASGGRVAPVRLSTQGMPLVTGEMSDIVGWGRTNTGLESHVLLKAQVPIVDGAECTREWQQAHTERVFCAGGVEGFDTCSGDSGGSLLFRGIQVGITSSGTSDCGDGVPSLYTNISDPEVRQFIRELTKV